VPLTDCPWSRVPGEGARINRISSLIRTKRDHVVGLHRERAPTWAHGSMGTVGDCYDNAPMESFWGSDLDPEKWTTFVRIWPCLPGGRHAIPLIERISAPGL
jgi:hypothetical protein